MGVQPWGVAPTPVIPKVFLGDIGDLLAPSYFFTLLGEKVTLSELNERVWSQVNSLEPDDLNVLVEGIGPKIKERSKERIYFGGSAVVDLVSLPFSTRTRNAVLKNAGLFARPDLTIADIFRVPNLGRRSVIEFACVVEAAILDAEVQGLTKPREDQRSGLNPRAQTTPAILKSFFQLLGAYAAGEVKSDDLRSVLPEPCGDWPEELKRMWAQVGALESAVIGADLVQRYAVNCLLERWLAPVDERLRKIMSRRILRVARKDTLEELGSDLGITRERVRQLEKKANSHLSRLQQDEFAPIRRCGEKVRDTLGSAIPLQDFYETVSPTIESIGLVDGLDKSFTIDLLVYLGGPFYLVDNWLLQDKTIKRHTAELLRARRDDRGLISDALVTEVLDGVGIQQEHHLGWLKKIKGLTKVDGGYIFLLGTILDKAKALIAYHNRPMTVEEMGADVGSTSVRSVRQRLMDDSGFWRVNRQNQFVIAGTPGFDEYTGIVDEIIQELEACGGRATVRHLVDKLTSVYGVAEASVNAYLATPMFTRDREGNVRVRDENEAVEFNLDISKTSTCYAAANGGWIWRIELDAHLVRGSGRSIPDAFAQVVGCGVGEKIEIDSDLGRIVFSWPMSSASGASVGSLRAIIEHFDAEVGDYLFLTYDSDFLQFSHISKSDMESVESSLARAVALVGRDWTGTKEQLVDNLSGAVLFEPSGNIDQNIAGCRARLKSRGDVDVARLLEKPKLSVDGYLENIEKMFGP